MNGWHWDVIVNDGGLIRAVNDRKLILNNFDEENLVLIRKETG